MPAIQALNPAIDWHDIDTVLLDMDGTLLDLHSDDVFWGSLLPTRYAERHGVSVTAAKEHLFSHMREVRPGLAFYSVPYWSDYTGLDLPQLKRELVDLIRFLPGVEDFLGALATVGKPTMLATNAHRESLVIKDEVIALSDRLDGVYISHEPGAAKESQEYWHALRQRRAFDPARTLFLDDNEPVLTAARDFGIGHTYTIARPNLNKPARDNLSFPAIADYSALAAELLGRPVDGTDVDGTDND